MVEDIVEIYTHLDFRTLTESEKLAHTEIHSPRSGPDKRVSLRDVRVVENVSARRWQRKRSRIKEPVTTHARIRIANNAGTEIRAIVEVAHGIDKATRDIARENRTTVVADPERCKAGTALG